MIFKYLKSEKKENVEECRDYGWGNIEDYGKFFVEENRSEGHCKKILCRRLRKSKFAGNKDKRKCFSGKDWEGHR